MTLVGIGTFARMTHIAVPRLRHYHDTGVLPAADVDDATGYRRYSLDQVDDALLIARLREVHLGLPEIGSILAASGDERSRLLGEHLDRVRTELTTRQRALGRLQAALAPPTGQPLVEYRELVDLHALVVRARVERAEIDTWCPQAFALLYERLGTRLPTGPGGALYGDEFFTADVGEVTAFVPVRAGEDSQLIPGGAVAVAVHEGPFADFDRTYATLGAAVASAAVAAEGAIRETYVIGPPSVSDPQQFRTEVAWPITEPVLAH